MRMVTTMHAKHTCRKGCVMFVVRIYIKKGKDVEDAEIFKRHLVIHQFQYAFLVDIPEFPANMEV